MLYEVITLPRIPGKTVDQMDPGIDPAGPHRGDGGHEFGDGVPAVHPREDGVGLRLKPDLDEDVPAPADLLQHVEHTLAEAVGPGAHNDPGDVGMAEGRPV